MRIRVFGIPAAQGSKVARPVMRGPRGQQVPTGKVNMVESSKALPPWRDAIRQATAEQRAGRTFAKDQPLMVILHFYLPRPAGHYGTGKNSGIVRPSAPRYPCGKKNDLDKLERAVMDGLTAGGAWYDDGQVALVTKGKFWADDGELPGCTIWISSLPATVEAPPDTKGDAQ